MATPEASVKERISSRQGGGLTTGSEISLIRDRKVSKAMLILQAGRIFQEAVSPGTVHKPIQLAGTSEQAEITELDKIQVRSFTTGIEKITGGTQNYTAKAGMPCCPLPESSLCPTKKILNCK